MQITRPKKKHFKEKNCLKKLHVNNFARSERNFLRLKFSLSKNSGMNKKLLSLLSTLHICSKLKQIQNFSHFSISVAKFTPIKFI